MYNKITLFLLASLISICHSNPTPNPTPAPSPTKFLAPRDTIATSCNADNCYRAAKSLNENFNGGYYGSLNPLCSSYTSPPTVVTSLTSSPLTLSSSCSAPRITSICDCLAPPPACATRASQQRVQNPSFEQGYANDGGAPYWSFSDTAKFSAGDTATGNYDLYNNAQQDYDGNWGLTIWADGTSGTFTATQTNIPLCAGYKYAFSAYVGYAYFTGPDSGPVFASNITVYFNDQVIVPTQATCTSKTQCNKPTPQKPQGFEAGFRQIVGTAPVLATDGKGTVKIVVSRDVSANSRGGPYSYDITAETLLDLITLTRVG